MTASSGVRLLYLCVVGRAFVQRVEKGDERCTSQTVVLVRIRPSGIHVALAKAQTPVRKHARENNIIRQYSWCAYTVYIVLAIVMMLFTFF